jgi:hypothetical protein
MNNKILITVIVLLLGSVLVNSFMPFGVRSELFITISLYLALYMMLANGTFMTTRYAIPAQISIGLYVLGVIFKIMHLTGADQILIMSFGVVFVLYTIHFASKQPKNLLDYLKMLMLLSLTSSPLKMLYLLPNKCLIFW